MKKGLFDNPPAVTKRASVNNEDHSYKALAGTAIAAATLAFLSPLAFIDWWLLVIPAVGFCLGLVFGFLNSSEVAGIEKMLSNKVRSSSSLSSLIM